jgi:hypothetical protein
MNQPRESTIKKGPIVKARANRAIGVEPHAVLTLYSDLVALVVAIASDPKDLGEPIGENMAEMYM